MSEYLRIGDAERERATADLGEHFAQGRLSIDEHADRLDRIWDARTEADLVPLFRDLPGGDYGARTTPVRRTQGGRGGRRRIPFIPLIALLILITVVTHVPVIWFALLGFLLFRAAPWRRRHYWAR